MNRRELASSLLGRYGRGEDWTLHSAAVADAAEKIGAALNDVDVELLWSMGLLHDIGRCITHDPIMHGVEGYRLLSDLGHHEEAFVCASHILFGLRADEAFDFGLPPRDFLPETLEQRIAALADCLVDGTTPTTLGQRFSSLRKRHANSQRFVAGLDRAEASATEFMVGLERQLGVPVAELLGRDEPHG